MLELVEALKIPYALAFLIFFSVQDYKYRDISDRLVYAFLGGSLIFFAVTLFLNWGEEPPPLLAAHLSIGAFVFLVILLIYRHGMMGKGDLFVISSTILLAPLPSFYRVLPTRAGILPPVIPVLLYSTGALAALSLLSAVYVVARHWELLRGLPLKYKLLFPIAARPLRLADYLERDFYYPLQVPRVEGGELRFAYRASFDVEKEDPRALKEIYRKLVESGIIKESDYIWASYGIPFLVPYSIGFALFLLLGDRPIISLLLSLLG